jgi:hypothetical protein
VPIAEALPEGISRPASVRKRSRDGAANKSNAIESPEPHGYGAKRQIAARCPAPDLQAAMHMVTGSCLCGRFHFTVAGSFGDVRYCHCTKCRRNSGTAFSANAKIDRSQWSLDGPADLITEFEHNPGLFKAFCSICGSPLYARSAHDPDDIRARLGGFDGPIDAQITAHVHTSWKSAWYDIEDSLPCFAGEFTD